MSKIRHVVVHIADNADLSAIANQISEYHADLIARRLQQSDLSAEQKIAVIDRILEKQRAGDL